MRFIIPNQKSEDNPVEVTLKMEQYFGCKLPTLYANGIPILHIIPDGRICIRSGTDTNLKELQKMGFQTENTKYKTVLNYDSNYSMVKTISSTDLGNVYRKEYI